MEDKIQSRIMGEYSIAKSFKGILRIAHIIDQIEGDPDTFLNPTYYGTPTARIDISGKATSKQKGTATAYYSLNGDNTIKRYNSDDHLKNRRVPMTDSMGNFVNWWVGTDGVTIGSDENINGNNIAYNIFYQSSNPLNPIYQKKFFPIFESRQIIIGRENKLHRSDVKSGSNFGILEIEDGATSSKLIIENLFDKSKDNSDIITSYDVSGNPIELRNYNIPKKAIGIDNQGGTVYRDRYKKLRTIYNNTKLTQKDYDVLLYRQNNWDYDNYKATTKNDKDKYVLEAGHNSDFNKAYVGEGYDQGDVLDCNVDFENITDYVKEAISKYINGNIIEVPTGTVIWQYCSLDKWLATKEYGEGEDVVIGEEDCCYPGNRPQLETRKESSELQLTGGVNSLTDRTKPFFNSILQGACKKINRLKARSIQSIDSNAAESDSSLTLEDKASFIEEIIPLYKRDYVLCDGSTYRIPYYPNFKNSNLQSTFQESKQRFWQLFFNIGYKYTPKEKMLPRCKSKYCDLDKEYHLVNSQGKFIIPRALLQSDLYKDRTDFVAIESTTHSEKNYSQFVTNPQQPVWTGEGTPAVVKPIDLIGCDDHEIYYSEDLATMIACDIAYEVFKKLQTATYTPTYAEVIAHIKDLPFEQKNIFNSFVGYSQGIVVDYLQTKNGKNEGVFKINIGKEVNSMNSNVLFYDTTQRKVKSIKVYRLPMVNHFIHLICEAKQPTTMTEGGLIPHLYTYYNYDFCVPTLTPKDDSPSFLGSGGYAENDKDRVQYKTVVEWKSKYTHSTIPHRHGVFAGKTVRTDMNDGSTEDIPSHYKGSPISSSPELPVNVAGFNSGELFKFGGYHYKGGWEDYKTETGNNYAITPMSMEKKAVKIDGMYVTVLNNEGTIQNSVDFDTGEYKPRNYYGYKTGPYRVYSDPPSGAGVYPSTRYDSLEVTDFSNSSTRELYRNWNLHSWYGLLPWEDQRFDNAEPNRGLTSEPIITRTSIMITYEKMSKNSEGYGTDNNAIGKYGFFSPEHITMLPLIKL